MERRRRRRRLEKKTGGRRKKDTALTLGSSPAVASIGVVDGGNFGKSANGGNCAGSTLSGELVEEEGEEADVQMEEDGAAAAAAAA
jgi:hypothetical protein